MANANRARQGASVTSKKHPAVSNTALKGTTPGAEHVVFHVGKDASAEQSNNRVMIILIISTYINYECISTFIYLLRLCLLSAIRCNAWRSPTNSRDVWP